jgi:protein-disulfide isomerase
MSSHLIPPIGPDDHARGPADAPLTLVEYGDYECPYCGRAHPIVRSIQRRLGDQLRFVFRHFPLAQVHLHAEHAAEMAEAAADRGKFWAMHDLLYENRSALEDEDLIGYAASLRIDPAWAAAALRSHAFADRVREDFLSGVRSGVNGTPTFFINGVRHEGAWDEESLLEALAAAVHVAER